MSAARLTRITKPKTINTMKNSEMPAHPIEFPVIKDGVQQSHQVFTGLTKREYFAGLAMKGYMSNGGRDIAKPETVARKALEFADALLAELEKPQP